MLRPQVCSLPPDYRTLLRMSLLDGLQAFENGCHVGAEGGNSPPRLRLRGPYTDCLPVLSFSVLSSLFLLPFLPLPDCGVVLRIASESSLLIRIPGL